MSNPLSTYDLIYKGLSEEDRTKLESDIAALLAKSVEEVNKQLVLGVQKAATEAYNNLLVNPWPQLLAENAGVYGAIQAIADDIWETMLKAKPGSDPGDFRIQEFLRAWSQNYPEHFAAAVGEAAAKRIEELERLVRTLNRR